MKNLFGKPCLIILNCFILFSVYSYGQPCFIKISFISGFHEKKVSFYINDKPIFKNEDLSTIRKFASAELTRMFLLLAPDSDSTFYVANTYSTATYDIVPYLRVKKDWYSQGLTLKVVMDGKQYIRKVDVRKGNYIGIYHDGQDLVVYESKEPYRND